MNLFLLCWIDYGIMRFLDACVEYNLHSAKVTVRVLWMYYKESIQDLGCGIC